MPQPIKNPEMKIGKPLSQRVLASVDRERVEGSGLTAEDSRLRATVTVRVVVTVLVVAAVIAIVT